MRTCLIGLAILMLGGCGGGKSGAATGSAAANNESACLMESSGRKVLRMTLTTESTCTSKDGHIHLHSAAGDFDVWLARGVTTVDDGVKRIERQVVSEFKGFKATSTASIDISGSPARRLSGDGVEADDNDPGIADVIVFKTGPNIFIACTHAETLSASAKKWMADVVSTARVP